MRYSTLPGTDRKVSQMALGTAWFGTDIDADRAFSLMDAYVEHGGTLLDTAHMYASWVDGGAGQSEKTVGAWVKKTGREHVIVATKGADQGMTRDDIRRQFDESLDRLGMSEVDFYWLHVDKPDVPVGEVLGWLNELVDEGKFAAFGCSNWSVERIADAQAFAASNNLRGFAASQIGWSLARANQDVIGGKSQKFMDDATDVFHRETKLPVMAYSSQAGGFFAGAYDPAGPAAGLTPNENIVKLHGMPANYRRLELSNQFAKAKGCTPNQISLAYLMHQPFDVFPIAGANSVERIADSLGAADITLSDEELAQLHAG